MRSCGWRRRSRTSPGWPGSPSLGVPRARRAGQVRAETRSRVERAVAQLGYEPNRIARGLSTGCTAPSASLVPDIATRFPGHRQGRPAPGPGRSGSRCSWPTPTRPRHRDRPDPDAGPTGRRLRCCAHPAPPTTSCVRCAATSRWSCSTAGSASCRPSSSSTTPTASARRSPTSPRSATAASPTSPARTPWVNRAAPRHANRRPGLDLEVLEAGNVSPDFEGGVAVADQVLAARYDLGHRLQRHDRTGPRSRPAPEASRARRRQHHRLRRHPRLGPRQPGADDGQPAQGPGAGPASTCSSTCSTNASDRAPRDVAADPPDRLERGPANCALKATTTYPPITEIRPATSIDNPDRPVL